MRKVLFTLFAIVMYSTISYAGEWHQNGAEWQYQNDDGTYKTGWYQDVDTKWYYFDDQTSYMLKDATTPDGYVIGKDGVWIENNLFDVITDNYDKKIVLDVTAYSCPGGPRSFEHTVPTSIYYDEEYENPYGGTSKVTDVSLAKSGVPYMKCEVGKHDTGLIEVRYKFSLENGNVSESSDQIWINGDDPFPLLKLSKPTIDDSKIASIDIFVERGQTE